MRRRIDPQIGVPIDTRDSPIDAAIDLLLYPFVWVPTATVVVVGQKKFVFLCTFFCCNNAGNLVSFAASSPSSYDRRDSSAV